MSVLIEAITVVVKVDAVETSLKGGLLAFEAASPNLTFRCDGYLAAVGFMTPTDVEVFVRSLEREGLRYIRNGVSTDMAVVDQIRGPSVPCAWLDCGKDDQGSMQASLRGAPTKPMAVPANWRPGNKLTFRMGSGDDLEIDDETGLRYFVDDEGQKQYLGQRFEENDPQARLMLATPRLLHFAKSRVWNLMLERGWQGLAHLRGFDPTHHLALRFKNQLGLVYVDAHWGETPLTPFSAERRASLVQLAASMRGLPIVAQCKLFAPVHMRSRSRDTAKSDVVRLDLGPGDLRVDDPVVESLTLIDMRTNRVVAESKFDVRETIEISDWELLDFAVQVVRAKLEENKFSIESWTTESNSDPHIVATKDGLVHRVVVGAGRYPVAEPIYDQNRLMSAAEETLVAGGALCKAPALVANAMDEFEGRDVRPLYRGEGSLIKFDGLEHVTPATAFSGRAVRIFVSSTFKDFEREREALAGRVLRELQRRAAERGVSVSLIDLRWGIPRADVAASQEVAACIREIASSHPFFLALLGKRHGTVASDAALSALPLEQAWLKQREAMSITELEIVYSMLKPSSLNSSALVFARGKAKPWSKKRALDIDPRYKPLVSALVASGYQIELMNNDFEDAAQERLWALIDRHYPHVHSADTGLSSVRKHRQFAFYASSMLPPDVAPPMRSVQSFNSSWEARAIAGAIGLAERRRDRLVFEHFFALENTPGAMQLFNMRLLEFKERTTGKAGGSRANIGSTEFTRELLDALSHWSSRSGREVFVLLAETDRLAGEEHGLLATLDAALRGSVYATRVGDAEVQQHLDNAHFLRHYLSLSGKVLDADDAELLLRSPLANELSFLRFAADHLIDAATHADLQPRLRELASVETFEQLSRVVRDRLDRLCTAGDNWRKVISFGSASSGVLNANQLEDAGLTPASYSRIQNAFAPMMECWGDWKAMHSGPPWMRLAAALL
ncbi:MAG: DUF4062 domain-containing protein [Hyphomonadaceae bacterium]